MTRTEEVLKEKLEILREASEEAIAYFRMRWASYPYGCPCEDEYSVIKNLERAVQWTNPSR